MPTRAIVKPKKSINLIEFCPGIKCIEKTGAATISWKKFILKIKPKFLSFLFVPSDLAFKFLLICINTAADHIKIKEKLKICLR